MVVISSVIAVISIVSLYEHFSARNWQQVTSQTRNNLVFENRNQKYGAFIIRKDYDKKLMQIMFSFILTICLLYSSYLYFKKPFINSVFIEPGGTEIPYNFGPPPVDKEEIVKQKPQEQKNNSQKFVELIVKNELVKNDTSIVILSKDTPTGLNPTVIAIPIIPKPKVPETYKFPDVDAYFPGGEPARKEFIVSNIVFPTDGFDSDGGKCFLEFIVSSEGQISSVKVIKGVEGCKSCDTEAIRVVKSMPDWEPAKVEGKPVDSYFNMVINFLIE